MSIPSYADRPFGCPPVAEVEPITVTLSGPPRGKGRARHTVRGGFVRTYTPEKTRTYEGMIRTAAMAEMVGRQPLDQPVEMILRAVCPIPASWPLRKQQKAITGEIKPTTKPDIDNVWKAWADALNGVVFRDDALIVRATVEKRYGLAPLVVCTVRAIP